jgi:purine-binding chemotaxis protein CheW
MQQTNAFIESEPGAITQFLTFTVGDEEYGIEILRVQEIKGYTRLTPIPNSPHFMKGVMNLRGTVVPVIGLRETFGMPVVEYGRFSVIVVVAVLRKVVGLLVDAVSEVVDLTPAEIDLTPELGSRVDTSMIKGMGRLEDKFVILLEVDRIVAGIENMGDGSANSHDEPMSASVREAREPKNVGALR